MGEEEEEVEIIQSDDEVQIVQNDDEVEIIQNNQVETIQSDDDVEIVQNNKEVGIVQSNEEVGIIQNEEVGIVTNDEEIGIVQNSEVGMIQNDDVGMIQNDGIGTIQNDGIGTVQNYEVGIVQSDDEGEGDQSDDDVELVPSDEDAIIDEMYIQNEIDKLNIEELIQPKKNHMLNKAIQKDRTIVLKIDDKISKLQKSCQYGKTVSKIINFKAESLSTLTLRGKLRLIINTFLDLFSEDSEPDTESQHNDDNNSFTHSQNARPKLSFLKISEYFNIQTLPYCTISYDTIPLHLFMTADNKFRLEIPKRRTYTRTKKSSNTYKRLKDYSHDNEPEIKLETYEQSMKLKTKLNELEKTQKNVKFYNFIIDCDPVNGFNETTFRLFLVTLLISKGHVEFYKNDDDILCIKSSENIDQNNENDDKAPKNDEENTHNSSHPLGEVKKRKKNQALLTSWSYSKWEMLVDQINKES
ncbi:conserved Plasmodium protein, unknown function [Plasmodium chabaudi chabaudi]|uniref:Uncharacterized protein n=1 Tax=Plasmodium chabaudi chabaudi TaxID=31271 RepID=A0A1C6YJ82_PLACU|nr:conserved Plasmodium protein, unknown function [Plasmodium chabaudi chabaudi]